MLDRAQLESKQPLGLEIRHEEQERGESERDEERHHVEQPLQRGRTCDRLVTRSQHARGYLDQNRVVEIAYVGHERESFAHVGLTKIGLIANIEERVVKRLDRERTTVGSSHPLRTTRLAIQQDLVDVERRVADVLHHEDRSQIHLARFGAVGGREMTETVVVGARVRIVCVKSEEFVARHRRFIDRIRCSSHECVLLWRLGGSIPDRLYPHR